MIRTDDDRFHVEPITPSMGAEVHAVDMRETDDELRDHLHA